MTAKAEAATDASAASCRHDRKSAHRADDDAVLMRCMRCGAENPLMLAIEIDASSGCTWGRRVLVDLFNEVLGEAATPDARRLRSLRAEALAAHSERLAGESRRDRASVAAMAGV